MNPQVLLIFDTRGHECAAMLKGVAHYQRLHRPWSVTLDDADAAGAKSALGWVRSKPWHGIISRHTPPALVQACAQRKLPLVDLADTRPAAGLPKIRPDHPAIGRLGAEYFLKRKFRHFAFCGFSDQAWSGERREGYRKTLAQAGFHSDVFDVKHPGDVSLDWDAKHIDALALWLGGLPDEVAVMACNDLRALQVVRAAQAAGRQIPEEVAVLGANNDALRCELSNPPVSSVAVDAFQAGRQAAATLDRLMAGEKPESMDLRIAPVGVVTRKSTDVLALRDKDVAVAFHYIREHACKGITVDQVLEQVPVTRSWLENKFRRHIGRSPQAEIRRVQIDRICQLLAETDLSLKDIAELTGFAYVEYLCVVFKRVTGETPGRYRQNVQAHEQVRALA